MKAPLPGNETERLAALRATGLLDSAPEPEYDDIVRLAAQICRAPTSTVSLVDAGRQWFKAAVGIPVCETDRDMAFCAHTILNASQPLIVPDAGQDPRFADNPLVVGAPFIRFYAGAPLVTKDGLVLGSLCVIDTVPRNLDRDQVEALQMLGRLVMHLVESRHQQAHLARQGESLRQATTALRNQQAELRVLFDFIPAMIVYKDTENRVLRANGRMAASAGLTVAEMEGRPIHELFPQRSDQYYADDLEVIRTGEPKLGIIESFADHTGRTVWIQTDKVPVRDSEGRVSGLVVMAQDITERKRSEERLHLLGSALEQCKDSIVITDAALRTPGPRIQYVNPAFTAMTGYASVEAVGQTLDIQQGPLSEPAAMRRLIHSLAHGHSSQGEVVSYRKDRTTFDLEWHVAPVRDATGTITHFVGVQRDVSARNAAAAELVRAREEALETGRLKSRFLANMSHELRTPLNTINGLAATLLEQDLPGQFTSPIGLILQCGESLLQNIQTILTHSSLESGKFSLESRPFAPAGVALNALRITGEKARRKGLVLDYHFDPGIPALVNGDAFRLQQVLVNLLANGIKFTDRGCVCLRVRALPPGENGISLGFTVADTGMGIPAAEVGQLFTPFAQAGSAGSRRHEGTGLGLAISQSLVELMGGSISVRSKPGVGSVFAFTVPFPVVPATGTIGTASALEALAGREILIEESRPLRRRMLRELAQAWRMQPTLVVDPAAARVAASERRFDFAVRPADGAAPAGTGAPWPMVWLHASVVPVPAPDHAVALSDLFSAPELSAALVSLLAVTPPAAARPIVAARKLGERIPLRILSADDIATNREMLTYLCRHLGYRTDLVVDGEELVQRVSSQAYDLLLIDINMPRLDGLGAAREICRRFPDPAGRPRLVAVTANALIGDRERCLAAGMDDYLTKPLIPKKLAECIERLFSEKPATVAAPAIAAPSLEVPLVDADDLATISDGVVPGEAADFIGQLRDAVVRDYDSLRAHLVAACAAQDAEDLEKIVHGLKGCFLSVGWARLGARCANAMAELRGGTFQDWTTLAGEIHALQGESVRALNRGLAAPTPTLTSQASGLTPPTDVIVS